MRSIKRKNKKKFEKVVEVFSIIDRKIVKPFATLRRFSLRGRRKK